MTFRSRNRNNSIMFLLILFMNGLIINSCSFTNIVILELNCEYQVNPLGIDNIRPRLGWILDSEQRGQRQTAYQVIVASTLKNIKRNEGDQWNTGKVLSGKSIHIEYDGKTLRTGQKYYWKVRVWDKEGKASQWSNIAEWEMALLDDNDWDGMWIYDGKVMNKDEEALYDDDPNPIFRKEFDISKTVKSARLYITGLGYYESYINGNKIGDHVLDPGFTDYSKHVLYSTYDITSHLKDGRNCIGIMLGNGWFNPLPMKMWGWLNLREHMTIGRPRTICQLNIVYNDGSIESISTDQSWRVSEGPIIRNNIYLGEVYDARKEQKGWCKPGFDDSEWKYAVKQAKPVGKLVAQYQPPIRITSELKPLAITEPKPGVYIFDMGINFAGLIELKVEGDAGTVIKLRYGELLYPDTLIFREDLRPESYRKSIYPGALNVLTSCCGQIKPGVNKSFGPGAPELACQSDTYILKGEGVESYIPRFTFRCFRYLEVTGLPGEPALDNITGYRLNSDVNKAGQFSCSNNLFNSIFKTTVSTVLSNLFSVQSDCSHRERFQYGGEITPTSEAIMFSFDMSNFYSKTVRDWGDAARPEGWLTEEAPFNGVGDMGYGGNSGPIGWAKVHLLLMSQLYQYYGNRQLLEEQYETAKRYVDILSKTHPDHIIKVGIGDHLSIDDETITWGFCSSETTAHYYHCARMLEKIAGLLDRNEDVRKYRLLSDRIKTEYLTKFLKSETGLFSYGTQTSQAFAINMDLVPEDEYKDAADRLVQQVMDKHNGHISTGTVGTKHLLNALDKIDRNDVAYTLVNQKSYPGWGYMLEKGATSLWERWIGSDDVYSNCHPAFGSVNEWFIKTLAGIRPDKGANGFDRIIIKPYITEKLTWVNGKYKSIHGLIISNWSLEDNTLSMNVKVPVNTTAKIYIPAEIIDNLTEGNRPVKKVKGIKHIGKEANNTILHLESGYYSFSSEISR